LLEKKRLMKRVLTKKVLGYFLWGLVLAGILIVWKFPYGSLQERLDAVARERLGLRFEATDVSPTLPPGLKLAKCTVRSTEPGSKPFLAATQVYLRFNLRSQVYGGSLKGDIRLAPFYDVRQYQLKLRGQTLRLDDKTDISALLGRQLSGQISGDLELKGDFGDIVNSTGGGELQLVEGSCPIDSPYLTIKLLEKLEVSGTFALAGGILKINPCQFKAPGFEGTLSGEIELQPWLPSSTLNLAGKGQIDPALVNLPPDKRRVAEAILKRGKPLPFKVLGTIEAPQLRLF
jgi:type II secretion system protein N